jgi:hypothetical protein
MKTQNATTVPKDLSGHHQHTYAAILRHPTAHNLAWHDVRSLLEAVAEVTEGHTGNLHVTRNGKSMSLHAPKHKDAASEEDLHAIRKFLELSGEAATETSVAAGIRLLVVIDHHEAKVYRALSQGGSPVRIEPYDPHGFGRHLRSENPETSGKREPERKSFHEAIAATLKGADAIMVFGDGTGASSAMQQLLLELEKHHHDVFKHVVGSRVVDEHHMTEGQLLAKVREFFERLVATASYETSAGSGQIETGKGSR